MLVDVLGSRVLRRASEFKNFPFYINNFAIDQSLLSLKSKALPTSMKEIDTTDLTDITIAYRDLNKGLWEQFLNSKSEILIIDLLSELRNVSYYKDSFFSTESLEYLGYNNLTKVKRIDHFRKLIELLDESFFKFLNSYEKVFLIKIEPNTLEEKEFIDGIYSIIEPNLKNKLLINIPKGNVTNIFNAPLEYYHDINMLLKKYNSQNYDTQLLFDEKIDVDKLSVYINYLEDRNYKYDLLKNGNVIETTDVTNSRYQEFKLKDSGKYRIRVHLADNSIKPRLSKTYHYNLNEDQSNVSYIELPDRENLWMVDILTNEMDIQGYVGSPFKYPFGYEGLPVYDKSEISEDILFANNLFSSVLSIVKNMDHVSFTKLNYELEDTQNEFTKEFFNFIKSQR